MKVEPGMIVRHVKKQTVYQVLTVGTHTETQEEFVVYESVLEDGKVWIRPLSMFVDGRFEKIGPKL